METWVLDDLEQGAANYGPWAKSRLLLVFVNKVLLEHSHTFVHYYQWLLFTAMAERSGWVRVPWPTQPNVFIVQPFRENVRSLLVLRSAVA